MRFKSILFVLLCLISVQAFSQVKAFRFGVKVAPDVSWLSPDSDNYESKGTLPGFSWGFLADVTLTENYFIKTGFNLDYLHGKLEYPDAYEVVAGSGETSEGTLLREYNLRYIELPVTLKMRTNNIGRVAIYGEIGFGASLNLKARSEDEFTPKSESNTYTSEGDIKDEITLFKASLIAGAGIEYFMDESTSLIFSINYNNGLTNILKGENKIDPSVEQSASLSFFQLNIGVMF